jgi:spore coat protein H
LTRTFGPGNGNGNLYEGVGHDFLEGAANHDFLELKDEEEGRTRDDIAALAEAASVPDEQFVAAVSRHLDLERFITAYALDGLLGHWDGPFFRGKNFYLYDNPADDRFVLVAHGMDLVFYDDFDPYQQPSGLLPKRIRSTPPLDARWRGEMNRLIREVWSVPVLLDRMARARATLHTADRSAPAVRRDLAQFDAAYGSMVDQVRRRYEQGTWG